MRLITTSVPPSILFQSPDNAIEKSQNVKVKRKCGRPRNPIPRHKRVSHLSAEHRRRGKIQDAFRSLKNLVALKSHVSGRVSKADVLFKAVEKCQDLESDIRDLKSSTQSLQTEKEALSLEMKAYEALFGEKDPVKQHPASTLDDLYSCYVQEHSKNNPCFRIFALMLLNPLFESFKMAVKVQSTGQFLAAVRDWAFIHITLPSLRAASVTTNDFTAGSDTVLKDHVQESNVSKPMSEFDSQKSVQVSSLTTVPMPIVSHSHCTNSFCNSLSVFKKRSCLQSIQSVETPLGTTENECFGKDSPVDSQLNSTSQPRYQSVAKVCGHPESPCFAADTSNGCKNSEHNDYGSHNFQARFSLNKNQGSSDESQLNCRSSFYTYEASERPLVQSKNSNNSVTSAKSLHGHHAIKNIDPFLPNSPATISKDAIGDHVSHVEGRQVDARLSSEIDRSRLKNVTCIHSSHEPCRYTKISDHFPKDHSIEKSHQPYGVRIERPNILPLLPEEQIKPIPEFFSPKVNEMQTFVLRPVFSGNSHHSRSSHLNSRAKPSTVEQHFHDPFHSYHIVTHSPHERRCLTFPSSRQNEIDPYDVSYRPQRDNTTQHQELSPGSPLEFTPSGKFPFLSQLLGTSNSTDQSIDATEDRDEESLFMSGLVTASGHDTDICQISPKERSKFYQPVSSHSSFFSSLDFTPHVSLNSGRSHCRFPVQSKHCQGTLSLPEPLQCPSPSLSSYMPCTQASDQFSPGILDNMWSMTRSDQVSSPCSDVVTQRGFTSPFKTVQELHLNLGQIHDQRRDSLNHCHRTISMENKMKQGNEVLSPRSSPLTYINMDADQIVLADDKANEKQLFQMNKPLGSQNEPGTFSGKLKFDNFWTSFKRRYSKSE